MKVSVIVTISVIVGLVVLVLITLATRKVIKKYKTRTSHKTGYPEINMEPPQHYSQDSFAPYDIEEDSFWNPETSERKNFNVNPYDSDVAQNYYETPVIPDEALHFDVDMSQSNVYDEPS